MLMQHRFSKIILVIILLIIGIFIFRDIASSPKIKTSHVIRGKAVEAVYATAIVEPVTWSAIAPPRTGRIMEINSVEGQPVTKGDVLARLDDADLHAQLQEVKVLEQFQIQELNRTQKLANSGAAATEKLELRTTNLAQTRAKIKMIEEQIKQLTTITAPMDGIILWRDVELGEVKDANKIIFWVGLPSPLRLKAEVDEEDIPKISQGQKTFITADAFPDKVITGKIDRVSPKGDSVNKSYRVYISLPEDTKLMIGMTVETNSIIQEKDQALLIPTQALTDDSFAWLVTQNILHKTKITKGITGKENTEILEGIKEGDVVALPPFDKFTEGMKISINKDENKK